MSLTMNHNFMQDKARELRMYSTEAEKLMWNNLRNRKLGYKFVRQLVIDEKYIVDFVCAEKRIILEIDGGQHCDNEQDKLRDEYLQNMGYRVIRLWNNEVLNNIDGCLNFILVKLQEKI